MTGMKFKWIHTFLCWLSVPLGNTGDKDKCSNNGGGPIQSLRSSLSLVAAQPDAPLCAARRASDNLRVGTAAWGAVSLHGLPGSPACPQSSLPWVGSRQEALLNALITPRLLLP